MEIGTPEVRKDKARRVINSVPEGGRQDIRGI
jgi:hypothetical protein